MVSLSNFEDYRRHYTQFFVESAVVSAPIFKFKVFAMMMPFQAKI